MGIHHGGSLPRVVSDWLACCVGTGSMARPVKKNYYYGKNWARAIGNAERKVEELKLRRMISDIDNKLEILRRQQGMYPPPKATDTELSEVHTAPLPDQESNDA